MNKARSFKGFAASMGIAATTAFWLFVALMVSHCIVYIGMMYQVKYAHLDYPVRTAPDPSFWHQTVPLWALAFAYFIGFFITAAIGLVVTVEIVSSLSSPESPPAPATA